MARAEPDGLALLDVDRLRTIEEDRALSDCCRQILIDYRVAVAGGKVPRRLAERARRAFLHLGGDPSRSTASLKHYDHARYGPFLGVSDEGSAAGAIRDAALASPKIRALPKAAPRTPLVVGVAVDAERLGGIGEVNVGAEEYADIWLDCVDRVLVTTNVGTRVNMRVYRREPLVIVKSDSAKAIASAKDEISKAFQPFVETPDRKPRPLTVFVDVPNYVKMTAARKRALLEELAAFVASGKAAGKGRKKAPDGQALGLATWVKFGPPGRDQAKAAIALAAKVGIKVVLIDGVKQKEADRAVSLAGLLDYFRPGLVAQILREGKKHDVLVRPGNLPDTDTIARSTWVGLTTARTNGANLGKYGCFPLTLDETDRVVQQIQGWLKDWSAAPVFFVDQGLIRDGAVDVGHDLARGVDFWLRTVAKHGVKVVLIDTIDKATGKRLLRKDRKDATGFLALSEIERIETLARELEIKVLWAGGLGLRDAFAMGKLGVFGIYVTSAAATTIPVAGTAVRDPSLAGLKEPSKEAVLRTKILLEAGFLSAQVGGTIAARIDRLADKLLAAHDNKDAAAVQKQSAALASACTTGWRAHWKH
jgi:hypothetical protein